MYEQAESLPAEGKFGWLPHDVAMWQVEPQVETLESQNGCLHHAWSMVEHNIDHDIENLDTDNDLGRKSISKVLLWCRFTFAIFCHINNIQDGCKISRNKISLSA